VLAFSVNGSYCTQILCYCTQILHLILLETGVLLAFSVNGSYCTQILCYCTQILRLILLETGVLAFSVNGSRLGDGIDGISELSQCSSIISGYFSAVA
jgi:hypothetical protein